MAEDVDGFIWVGTDKGLSRFDGTLFKNFTHSDADANSLPHNFILDVLPDIANGKIWVAHKKGLSVLDITNDKFHNYFNDKENQNSAPSHRAYSLFKDQAGVIWIGFQAGGLLRYRPETDDFARHLCLMESNGVYEYICEFGVVDIKPDAIDKNTLWLATHYGLIEFFKDSGDYHHYVFDDNNEIVKNRLNNILALFSHENGKIYFATIKEGLAVFDKNSKLFSMFEHCEESKFQPFDLNASTSFQPISEHKFWLNSKHGTQLFDINSKCIEKSFANTNANRYAFDHIDHEGRIWTSSTDLGLFIYNPLLHQSEQIFFESSTAQYPSKTRKILEDPINKKLYVLPLASRGLFIYDQLSKNWECIPPAKKDKLYESIGFQGTDMTFLSDGKLLILGGNKLYLYRQGDEELNHHSLQSKVKNPKIRNILHDHNNEFWISTSIDGIYRVNSNVDAYTNQKELIKDLGYRLGCDFMAEDINGNIWLREHNGLLIYERATDKYHYFGHDEKNKTAIRGMGAIETDEDGNIWIAGQGDYFGYAHADSLTLGVIKFYGKQDGLKGNNVYLVKKYQNKLLVFTDLGMQIFNPISKQFEKHYTSDYGFGNNISTATTLANGSLVVGNNKSINFFRPEAIRNNLEKPKPYISSFSVFDKTWKLKSSPSQSDTIRLSYKQNFFSFEFSSISYNITDKVKFSYKLEGFDENWQNDNNRRFAAYTNVPGGDYRFIVKAENNEGLSIEQPSITYLHISTVWYKQNWFSILALLLISTISYLIYKWRIEQVRKEERVKSSYEKKLANVEMSALRAQMNPHFIFNSLNSIEYYIINNDAEQASDYLNRFSRLMRLILQNSKNSVVPLKDDLEALKLYIEMESMRFDDLFDYEVKFENDIDLEKIKVPPMLFQPYVENSIWHGLMQKSDGRGRLELSLSQVHDHLICIIEDNGIGRLAAGKLKSKSATKRKSYGMKITSDRLAMLNNLAGSDASVKIVDLKDETGNPTGTRVELIIPL